MPSTSLRRGVRPHLLITAVGGLMSIPRTAAAPLGSLIAAKAPPPSEGKVKNGD